MKKLRIALVTGGDVAERGISLLSAQMVKDHLDKNKYEPWIIDFNNGQFVDTGSGKTLSKADFSLTLDERITFDLIYPILHGHPAENGVLQAYLDLIGIPYTGCGQLAGALTFNKQACKTFLKSFSIPMANSLVLKKNDPINIEEIEALGFPLFIKPNQNGSSYGVSKVNTGPEILPAITKAFEYDQEIIIESFISGVEYSNGVLKNGPNIEVLPITEIIPDPELAFFDYDAKYENKSQEITPARLSKAQTEACQQMTALIYKVLDCKGICRVDYILMNGQFYFLEINTIPGFSPNSLVPQQAKAAGISITALLDMVIAEALES